MLILTTRTSSRTSNNCIVRCFSVCFAAELILRVVVFGRSYFNNALNAMDAFVVLASTLAQTRVASDLQIWVLSRLCTCVCYVCHVCLHDFVHHVHVCAIMC